MGQRGPRPVPTEILAARGSWRAAARDRAGEPRAPSIAPAPPDSIAADEGLLEEWHTLCERIAAIQTLSHVDAASIERYCHLSLRYKRATAFILDKGITYPILTKEGEVKYFATYPQVAEANSCATQMLKLEHEFGLTPASRVGLTATAQGNANSDAEDSELLD
jgi:P27 family predicted phage terminase small subunit